MDLVFFHTADVSVCGFIDDMQFLHDCYLFSLIILQKLAHFLLNSVRFSFVGCFFALSKAIDIYDRYMTLLHGDFAFFASPRYRAFPDFLQSGNSKGFVCG